VPFWLEGMEHQLDEFRTLINRGLKKRPKEYFAHNFWVSFWFEQVAPMKLLDEIGVDRVMFETDYPHPTSLYPDVQARLAKVMEVHSWEVRRQVLETNAKVLYNLDI